MKLESYKLFSVYFKHYFEHFLIFFYYPRRSGCECIEVKCLSLKGKLSELKL